MPTQTRIPKLTIVCWAVLGAQVGWLVAAWVFLEEQDEYSCVHRGLITMLGFSLYGSRQYPSFYGRIILSVILGGLFVTSFTPQFVSPVPYGLAGGLLFLVVLVVTAPGDESRMLLTQTRLPKLAIASWAVLGALVGWFVAAWAFLEEQDVKVCVHFGLITMLGFSLYGSRQYPSLSGRIVLSVLLGGLFFSSLPQPIAGVVADRSDWIFAPGPFTPVPCGLAGGLLFLAVLVAIAPVDESRNRNE